MLLSNFTIFGFFGLSAFAAAQEMPDCAAECLVTNLEGSDCGPTDFECICADIELMANVQTCAMGTCTVLEGLGKSCRLLSFVQNDDIELYQRLRMQPRHSAMNLFETDAGLLPLLPLCLVALP